MVENKKKNPFCVQEFEQEYLFFLLKIKISISIHSMLVLAAVVIGFFLKSFFF